jgi:hypothetical protein
MTEFTSPRTIRFRKSHAAKTGAETRSSKILANALFGEKPEYFEDADGYTIRRWKSSELSSYSNADLKSCLQNRVAVEPGEMLGTVPPSAIKHCVTKGWLVAHGTSGIHFVTAKAARELDLPVRFKGGLHHARKIRFVS